MSLSRVTLESFDDADDSPKVESREYLRGYRDGIAEVEARQKVNLDDAVANIAAALSDMSFGFAEARLHTLDRLRPLLAQIAETALPDILGEVFSDHLVEVLQNAFDEASRAPISVAVAPDARAAIESRLNQNGGSFRLVGDPTVGMGQAILQRDETQIMIDTSSLLEDLQAALHGLEHSERTLSNG